MNRDELSTYYNEMALDYEKTIREIVPHYDAVMDRMIHSLPFPENQALDVLDIGSGTGTMVNKIKERFCYAACHCMDISEQMLLLSKESLSSFTDITFENGNIEESALNKSYDVIIASMCLQNIATEKVKKKVYQKIYDHLKTDGIFLFFGPVLASAEYLRTFEQAQWTQFLKESFSEDVTKDWLADFHENEHPVSLLEEWSLIKEVGFSSIDIVYKQDHFAIISSQRLL